MPVSFTVELEFKLGNHANLEAAIIKVGNHANLEATVTSLSGGALRTQQASTKEVGAVGSSRGEQKLSSGAGEPSPASTSILPNSRILAAFR